MGSIKLKAKYPNHLPGPCADPEQHAGLDASRHPHVAHARGGRVLRIVANNNLLFAFGVRRLRIQDGQAVADCKTMATGSSI